MKTLGRFDCSTELTNIIAVKNDLVVRTSSSKDKSYIDKLQKENSYAVGFIQKTIWDEYVFGGKRNFVAFTVEKNGDRVGYILVTPGKGIGEYAKIQQIAIQEDARRLEYGTMLIDAVRQLCEQLNRVGVTLRCRKDLDANKFWQALGFKVYGIWEKGKVNHVGFKASDDIILWRIELNEKMPALFTYETDYPFEYDLTGIIQKA